MIVTDFGDRLPALVTDTQGPAFGVRAALPLFQLSGLCRQATGGDPFRAGPSLLSVVRFEFGKASNIDQRIPKTLSKLSSSPSRSSAPIGDRLGSEGHWS
jgi:hypothetical protein